MIRRVACFALGWSLASLPSYGHHNSAAHYLLKETQTVKGVVTKFSMVNPHVRLYFNVKAANGQIQPWVAEGNSVSFVEQGGWTRDSVKPGDVITVTGRPSRDGSHWILWSVVEKQDGTRLLGGNSVDTFAEVGIPKTRQEHFEQLRQKLIQQRKSSATPSATPSAQDPSKKQGTPSQTTSAPPK